VLASDSSTEAGVVSDGKLSGDDHAPAMAEAVQAGPEQSVSAVVTIIAHRAVAVAVILVSIAAGGRLGERCQ
jgi:hypothetical protein